MENKFKRFLSLALAVFMLISLIPVTAQATDVATVSDETVTLYLENANNWSDVKAYYWNAGGDNGWPGVSMTHEGGNIWSVEVPVAYTSIIFNGSGDQTADLSVKSDGAVYNNSTAAWTENATILYVNNASYWSQVCAFYWNDSSSNGWPGTTMAGDSSNVYSIVVPSGYDNIIFNKGYGGDGNQTADLKVPASGSVYNNSQWQFYAPTTAPVTLYFENTAGWAAPTAYIWNMASSAVITNWPGAAMTNVEGNTWSVEVPAGYHGVIFSDNGSNQTADMGIPTDGNDLYNPNSGWSKYVPPVYVVQVGDDKYETLEDAIAVAVAGDTIQLIDNCVAATDSTVVGDGVVLDLNGNQLTVDNLVAYGNIVDGEAGGNGSLIVNERAMLLEDNQFLPLYDAANTCYRFFQYELVTKGYKTVDGTVKAAKFGFAVTFANEDGYKLLAETDTNGVKLTLDVSWTGKPEDQVVQFTFSDSIVAGYANAVLEGSTNMAMTVTVYRLDLLQAGDALTVDPFLAAESVGVKTSGTACSYEIPAE